MSSRLEGASYGRRAAEAAGHELEVIAVSRFSDPAKEEWLRNHGVKTVAADLLDRNSVRGLPDAGEVLYMVGLKFGTEANPSLTWAINTVAPLHVLERYAGRRVVALSTGNVYPLSRIEQGGSRESDPLIPLGEYANAAVARERLFDYGSREAGTRVALIRLNYATDLRYGVPVDLAQKVWHREPIDLRNGFFNCIWQGDANTQGLLSLAHCTSPPTVLNVTGPETVSVRMVAATFAGIFGMPAELVGTESQTAFLSNSKAATDLFGNPTVSLQRLIEWTAHWIKTGGASLGKPTHFEVRNGSY